MPNALQQRRFHKVNTVFLGMRKKLCNPGSRHYMWGRYQWTTDA